MYTAHGQLSLDTLIRQHAPLVRRIAQHMMARLPPSVELDDLIQVGIRMPDKDLSEESKEVLQDFLKMP